MIGFLRISPAGGNISVELDRFLIDIARSVSLIQAMIVYSGTETVHAIAVVPGIQQQRRDSRLRFISRL